MNHKFLIVLSVAVFYNGVIYASPVNNPEGALPEEKPPTALLVTNDNNKKIEPVQVPTTPITQKSSVPLNQSEIPATVHPDANSKSTTVPSHVPILKNMTHDLLNENQTAVINQKNSTLVTDEKNASHPIDNKSVTPVNETKTTTVPAGLPSSVSPSTLAPTAAPTAVPEKPTTTNFTSTTTPATISNTTSTTAKVDVTTIKPNSTTQNAVVVHDVVAPVQEKHFDGPSFIGGIVLTIGLTAIGFIAFKYYKAGKIDMNYRTL